jgi:hypothetical protein
MNITVLIPHYKSGKVTAHAVYQFLKNSGKHQVQILISDNNSGDGSIEYLKPFLPYNVKVFNYPKDKLQSHGIALDMMIPFVETDYFITAESDSYPESDKWLDYFEPMIEQGVDMAGSFMKLSGGVYLHPCGAIFKKSMWEEAKKYCNSIPYSYFPNMWNKEGFDGHTMIHDSVLQKVLAMPEDYFDLANSYKGLTMKEMMEKAIYYSSVVCPFHNGMGMRQESVKTYGNRTPESEVPNVMLDSKSKIIFRVGYEPNQWFTYWAMANNKKVVDVPTITKWMPNRENQQQEYTLMENGFKHIWAGSSYLDMKDTEYNDVYEFKHNLIEELYKNMPQSLKIN